MPQIEVVDWTDPRVAVLHAELAAETGGGLYRDRIAGLSDDVRAAALGSLVVDPSVIELTLLTLDDDRPVATAGIRRSVAEPSEWDVKRVYVDPSHRGRGLSRTLMLRLERYAREHGARTMVLQTGDLQPAAVGLYRSLGYEPCPAYPPYGHFPGELTFRKVLPTA